MTYERDDERKSDDVRAAGPRKMARTVKVFRATTGLVVFGLPLAIGACAVLGYGIRLVYKRITGSE